METSPNALFRYRTSNIGDDTQSYAIALHLPRIDALVDRDELARLALDQPHRCVMNSWFFLGADQGPPTAAIEPLFHGMSVGRSEMLEGAWRDYLAMKAPIGCRDLRSVEMLDRVAIPAYWSGCLTLMIGQAFKPVPREQRRGVYIIDVHPEVEALRVPPEIAARATRWTNEFDPLIAGSTGRRFAEVHRRMRALAHAELVITRRLHIALPCAGFGTPVLTLPNPGISDARHRFSGYESFLPIAWPETERVDFDFTSPEPCDIPAVLKEGHDRLCAALGQRPERQAWDSHTDATFAISAAAPPATRYGLQVVGDFDEWPSVVEEGGGRAIRVSGYPFAHKMAGEAVAAPAAPASVEAALETFSVRRVVGLIAQQVARETDVVRLDRLMRELAQGPLFSAVMSLWMPALREAGRHELEVDWRRAAVTFGSDSYETGRLIDVIWRNGDAVGAMSMIDEMRRALATQPFVAHGDDFHLAKNNEILDGFEAVFAFDVGATDVDDARLRSLHPFVIETLHDLVWDAHKQKDDTRAIRLFRLYAKAARNALHDVEKTLVLLERVLSPAGATHEAHEALAEMAGRAASTGQLWRKWVLLASLGRDDGGDGLREKAMQELSALFKIVSLETVLANAAFTDAFVAAVSLCKLEDSELPSREIARLGPFLHDKRARALAERLEKV